MKNSLIFFLPISLLASHPAHRSYGSHDQGTLASHSRSHSRGSTPPQHISPMQHTERLDIHIHQVAECVASAPSSARMVVEPLDVPTPRPLSPAVSPFPLGPYEEVERPITPDVRALAAPISEITRTRLALISLGSSALSAGLTALVIWRSSCDGK